MEASNEEITAKKWLLKKLAGTLSDDEEAQLQAWMAASPRHEQLAGRILSKEFMRRAVLDKNKEKRRALWSRIYHRMGYARSFRFVKRSHYWAAAAILAGVIALGSWWWIDSRQEPILYAGTSQAIVYTGGTSYRLEGEMLDYKRFIRQQASTSAPAISADLYRTIKVPRGGEFRLMLEDGTQIHLGPESSLTIPADYSREKRSVNLSGKAYMEVYKDSLHPFVVHTAKGDIRVLGTKLNIEAYEGEPLVKIALEEGRAELTSGKEHKVLPVGSMASIGADKRINLSEANLYECTAWHRNRLIFEDEPLEAIMHELGRWYCFDASFSSDRVRNFRVTIDMDKYDTFNELSKMLVNMNEIYIKIRKNQVLISETTIK